MSFYKHHIFVCTNRREAGNSRGCCAEKNADALRDYMKSRVKELGLEKVRVNNSGCLDCCDLGPCMVIYPEGIWYSCKTKEDVDEVINEHLLKNEAVKRLEI